MPVIVTAVFEPLPGSRDAAKRAIQAALPAVHEEAGCVYYALHDAADGSLVLIEKWESQELLDAHSAGAPVARLNDSLAGLLQSAPAVTVMAPLPGGDPAKGQI
ncbi:putative quinol monooxygenase [Saccharopolyspora sp. NPDC002686]|uniref:putative quinol monooxygenase n=1 Tax=Saccharopolyspora sp. NPDC002686 TaxID=3154541 RepID=UPI0033282A17